MRFLSLSFKQYQYLFVWATYKLDFLQIFFFYFLTLLLILLVKNSVNPSLAAR
jgi:hypothetical protein